MKIYEVSGGFGATPQHYYEPTLALAVARRIQMRKDGVSRVGIRMFEVDPTRQGIAEALNRLVSQFCLNEG